MSKALAGGAGMLLVGGAGANAQPTPSPAPTPQPASPAAIAQAMQMRRFDSKLTDSDIQNIAGQIDANAKAAQKLNPRGARLRNSDEPVTAIRVRS